MGSISELDDCSTRIPNSLSRIVFCLMLVLYSGGIGLPGFWLFLVLSKVQPTF